jgi:hypothetical protein
MLFAPRVRSKPNVRTWNIETAWASDWVWVWALDTWSYVMDADIAVR